MLYLPLWLSLKAELLTMPRQFSSHNFFPYAYICVSLQIHVAGNFRAGLKTNKQKNQTQTKPKPIDELKLQSIPNSLYSPCEFRQGEKPWWKLYARVLLFNLGPIHDASSRGFLTCSCFRFPVTRCRMSSTAVRVPLFYEVQMTVHGALGIHHASAN